MSGVRAAQRSCCIEQSGHRQETLHGALRLPATVSHCTRVASTALSPKTNLLGGFWVRAKENVAYHPPTHCCLLTWKVCLRVNFFFTDRRNLFRIKLAHTGNPK